ncbi:uncharacterized protein BCN122_II0332 [Burkholderia cenocepacia]|nr:uncharacterized protein BCN122_II0332 [Burkholderia cenocepacia]
MDRDEEGEHLYALNRRLPKAVCVATASIPSRYAATAASIRASIVYRVS